MKSLRSRLQEHRDQADLTPMLDCIFLLLLFFIVTSTFAEDRFLFDIKLPQARQARVQAPGEVIELGIDRAGRFALGGEVVAEEELHRRLGALAGDEGRQTLVVLGDRGCPYEKVVYAMEVAQALRITRVSMAVDRP